MHKSLIDYELFGPDYFKISYSCHYFHFNKWLHLTVRTVLVKKQLTASLQNTVYTVADIYMANK